MRSSSNINRFLLRELGCDSHQVSLCNYSKNVNMTRQAIHWFYAQWLGLSRRALLITITTTEKLQERVSIKKNKNRRNLFVFLPFSIRKRKKKIYADNFSISTGYHVIHFDLCSRFFVLKKSTWSHFMMFNAFNPLLMDSNSL